MRIAIITLAAAGALALAACQPAEDKAAEDAMAAPDAATDTGAMAPADGSMTTPPADGSMTPPADGSMAPANPDGTMAPGSTPPTMPPETTTTSPATTPPAQ